MSIPHFHTPPQLNTKMPLPKIPQFITKNPSIHHIPQFNTENPSAQHQKPLSSTHPSVRRCVKLRSVLS